MFNAFVICALSYSLITILRVVTDLKILHNKLVQKKSYNANSARFEWFITLGTEQTILASNNIFPIAG